MCLHLPEGKLERQILYSIPVSTGQRRIGSPAPLGPALNTSVIVIEGELLQIRDLLADPKGQCTNPYGWTKSMLEQILTDIQKADPEWNVILLRYFNPIGAHVLSPAGENYLPSGRHQRRFWQLLQL